MAAFQPTSSNTTGKTNDLDTFYSLKTPKVDELDQQGGDFEFVSTPNIESTKSSTSSFKMAFTSSVPRTMVHDEAIFNNDECYDEFEFGTQISTGLKPRKLYAQSQEEAEPQRTHSNKDRRRRATALFHEPDFTILKYLETLFPKEDTSLQDSQPLIETNSEDEKNANTECEEDACGAFEDVEMQMALPKNLSVSNCDCKTALHSKRERVTCKEESSMPEHAKKPRKGKKPLEPTKWNEMDELEDRFRL